MLSAARKAFLRIVVGAVLAGTAAGTALAQQITVANVGLAGPQSIRYDAANDRYLVANRNRAAGAGKGFISVVQPDGKVADLKWIAGGENGVELDDAKGTAIRGNTLYVCDLGTIRLFDLASGRPTGAIPVPGANNMNDLVIAADGTIYVTNSGVPEEPAGQKGLVFRIAPDGRASLFAAADVLPPVRANGIALDRDGNVLVVGGDKFITLNPRGQVIGIVTMPAGGLDGIVVLADGGKLISSLTGQQVYRVSPTGAVTLVVEGTPGASAIGWDSRRQVLLIPLQQPAALRFVPMTANGQVR